MRLDAAARAERHATTLLHVWMTRELETYQGDPHELFEAVLKMLEKPVWHAAAACREHPDLDWLPGPGGTTAAQRFVCSQCLVSAECEASADDHPAVNWSAGLSRPSPVRARPVSWSRSSGL